MSATPKQHRYLEMTKGHAWVKKHGFDVIKKSKKKKK